MAHRDASCRAAGRSDEAVAYRAVITTTTPAGLESKYESERRERFRHLLCWPLRRAAKAAISLSAPQPRPRGPEAAVPGYVEKSSITCERVDE